MGRAGRWPKSLGMLTHPACHLGAGSLIWIGNTVITTPAQERNGLSFSTNRWRRSKPWSRGTVGSGALLSEGFRNLGNQRLRLLMSLRVNSRNRSSFGHLGRLLLFASVMTCTACDPVTERARRYRPGTEVRLLISELGRPDTDQPFPDALRNSELCPAETTRLLEYRGPRVIPFVDHGPTAYVCVDKTDRVLSVRVFDT